MLFQYPRKIQHNDFTYSKLTNTEPEFALVLECMADRPSDICRL